MPLLPAKDLGANAAVGRAPHTPVLTTLAVAVRGPRIMIFLIIDVPKHIKIIGNDVLGALSVFWRVKMHKNI